MEWPTVTSRSVSTPPAPHDHFEVFRSIYSPDPQTLRTLAHVKRFLERWTGDAEFRHALLSGSQTLSEAARACGCEIDVASLLPVCHPDFVSFRAEANEQTWPLTAMWDRFIQSSISNRRQLTMAGYSGGSNPDYDVWRTRQMGRAFFDLGLSGAGIVHPPVAIELSSGCSVGCAFCGLTAEKFLGHASLAGHGREEWEDTISSLQDFFGDGLKTSFLYWATDPLDNPEYLDFLDIWHRRVGALPQTTTAIPLRDVAMTRAVLQRWNEHRGIPNRFSILTTRLLREVHASFTPEELFGVELVLQNKGATTRKTLAGRPYIKVHDAEAQASDQRPAADMSAGTIACVTGAIVNIRERTVKLVSPTVASERWPNGYVEFDRRAYENGQALKSVLHGMRERHMRSKLTGSVPIRFSSAVKFSHQGEAVRIQGLAASIENQNFAAVGDLIERSTPSPVDVLRTLTERGADPVAVVGTIEHLWSSGALEHVDAALVPSA